MKRENKIKSTVNDLDKDGLGDMWTCGTTLASAYVLCCLSAMWLQLQMIGKNLR